MPKNASFLFDRVAVVGVGLIGGSIGKGLKQRNLAGTVIGIGRNEGRLRQAVDLETICEYTLDLKEGVAGSDVVVICTPVNSIAGFVVEAMKASSPDTLITDGGSTKQHIVSEVHQLLGDDHGFVGSHPLAGGEKTGAEFADGDLFNGRDVILTPTEATRSTLIERCQSFWEALGANIRVMSPQQHDAVVSSISHLPHVVAALLSGCTPDEHLEYAATGWADSTRIAAGDVEMWNQIIQQNSQQLQRSLTAFETLLEQFKKALANDDFDTVRRLLEQGKKKRDAVAD